MTDDTTGGADATCDEGPAVRRLLDHVRHDGYCAGYMAAKAEVLSRLRQRWLAVSGDELPFAMSDVAARAYARRVLTEATNKVESLAAKTRRRLRGKGG